MRLSNTLGSIAAGLQPAAGYVSAGGSFAAAQSAAMGAYGTAIMDGVVGGAGAVAGAAGTAGLWLYERMGNVTAVGSVL